MSRKSLVFSFLTVFSLPLAAAQISGGAGNIQGILPLISEIIGLDVGNPYNVLGIVATLGIMNVSVYVILKVGAKKLDIQDTVLPGRDDGRNILAIMSTLVTLSIFGTGAAAGLIAGFQSMFLLGFTFLLIGAGVFIILGGTGGILGGGSYVAGKSAKATTEGIREGAQAMEQANEILETAEREESEGRERGNNGDRDTEHDEEADAEQKLNRVLEIFDFVEGDFQEVLQQNSKNIKGAIRNLENAEEDEEVEERAEHDIQQRIQRSHVLVQKVLEEIKKDISEKSRSINESDILAGRPPYNSGISSYGGTYGLNQVLEDSEAIEKRLNQIVSDIEEEEGFMGSGIKALIEASQEVVKIHQYTYELRQLLKEAEGDTEFMEKLSKEEKFKDLYADARDADKHEKEDLEPKLEQLEKEEEQLFEALKDADELLDKHLSLNGTLITLLEDKTSKGGKTLGIVTGVGELWSDLSSLARIAGDQDADELEKILGPEDKDGTIQYYVSDISNHVEAIDKELNSEYKKEQKGIQELEEYLENFSSTGA